MSNQMDPDALSSDLINAVIHFIRIPHARRALYELLNDPSFVHTDILDLPLEVLERVILFVDPKDLIALRLTCKKLGKAVTSKFTLVDIAAHPYFGKFIEAIILDTTCSLEYIESSKSLASSTTDGSLSYRDFYYALEQVFNYLSLYNNLNTLGLTDRNPTSFGIQELLSRPPAHLFKQQRGHIFSNIRYFAESANLNISQLNIDSVQALRSDSSIFIFANVNIGLAIGLLWDHERKSLEMTGLTEWVWPVPDNMVFGLLGDMTLISSASIKELILSSCHVRTDRDYSKLIEFLHTCSRTLEKVKLSGIVIEGNSTWSPVLRLLACAPHLMEFDMATLSRHALDFVNSERQDAVVLHIEEWFGHGDDVSAELKDLAAAVESDEFAWESLNDTEKWTYHMTGRKKIPEMLKDKSLIDSESITSGDTLDETTVAPPPANPANDENNLKEALDTAEEVSVFEAMTQEEREQQEDLIAYWDHVKTSGQTAHHENTLEPDGGAIVVPENAQTGLHAPSLNHKETMESDMFMLVEEVATMFGNLTLT
ncbi:hypothetical protein KCU91_g5476, partial [Aureobasidium melanogenum]